MKLNLVCGPKIVALDLARYSYKAGLFLLAIIFWLQSLQTEVFALDAARQPSKQDYSTGHEPSGYRELRSIWVND